MRIVEINDNSIDNNIVINPIKQEFGFLPKEESQMFASKSNNWVNPSANSQSVIEEDIAFSANTADNHSYVLPNSIQTPTDYIGIIPYNIPTTIIEKFSVFKYYDLKKGTLNNIYNITDNNKKINNISNGLQTLRIPANLFNTLLTDPELIAANNDKQYIPNYGKYYLSISPLSIDVIVTGFEEKYHYSWAYLNLNNDGENHALNKRRRIIQASNTNFKNTVWNFETSSDSGRLFGSVVEVWNNGNLKYTRVMAENEFNLSSDTFKCVLYPDNFGFNPNEIAIGDTLRIFPRESYFNNINFEVNYKNSIYNLDQILNYILNDAARDLKTGLYEVFDANGFTMDENGILQGNVVNTYQITATDRYELRKRINP